MAFSRFNQSIQTVESTLKELWIIDQVLNHYECRRTATPARIVAEALYAVQQYRDGNPVQQAEAEIAVTDLIVRLSDEADRR